jgi:hypothetical protein
MNLVALRRDWHLACRDFALSASVDSSRAGDRRIAGLRRSGFDTISFMFSADNPYTGVDVDDCRAA